MPWGHGAGCFASIGIVFRERAVIPDSSGWEKNFAGRFEVVAHEDVPAAESCLTRVAYTASKLL